MTVKELREKLKDCNDSAVVTIEIGYEYMEATKLNRTLHEVTLS